MRSLLTSLLSQGSRPFLEVCPEVVSRALSGLTSLRICMITPSIPQVSRKQEEGFRAGCKAVGHELRRAGKSSACTGSDNGCRAPSRYAFIPYLVLDDVCSTHCAAVSGTVRKSCSAIVIGSQADNARA